MEATTALDSASANTSNPLANFAESTARAEQGREHGERSHRRNRNRPQKPGGSAFAEGGSANPAQRDTTGNWRRRRPRDGDPSAQTLTGSGSQRQHHPLPRRPSPQHIQSSELLNTGDAASKTVETSAPQQSPALGVGISNRGQGQRNNRRGRNFIGSLTEQSEIPSAAAPSNPTKRGDSGRRPAAPLKDDLTSTLIHAISTPPYPDCLICFSAIRPAEPTWSCSPLQLVESDVDTAQCCWTTFHLKCIRSWAAKSVKEVAEAWRARGQDRKGEWRCPGCRTEREVVPTEYR